MAEPLIKNAIHQPDDPWHFMVITPLYCGAVATHLGVQLACAGCTSKGRALKIKEVEEDILDPKFYFPKEDVNMDLLELSEKKLICPLKGTAQFYHLKIKNKLLENAAWCYEETLDFDARIKVIQGMIAFDSRVHITEIK